MNGDEPSIQPRMVDISEKVESRREAHAQALVNLPEELISVITSSNKEIMSSKGPVFSTAIVAGTMAAKNCSQLIPFCHPLAIEKCQFNIQLDREKQQIVIDCVVSVSHKTGVEMEALTGASVAALTIYDMCKAITQKMEIRSVKLVSKSKV